MRLYKFLFPNKDICDEQEMYYRGHGFLRNNDRLTFRKGGCLSSSTYFNSISLNKWYDNTVVEAISVELNLKGYFSIVLCTADLSGEKIVTTKQEAVEFKSKHFRKIKLKFEAKAGIGYFILESLANDSVFASAEYSAEVGDDNVRLIKIAAGICTYKREEFIKANLQRLTETINDTDSILYNKMDVYVADNGCTLPCELNSDHIKIYENPNYGGAGGFTRTLIEAKKSGKQYTNFIFLDDDIVLDTHAIEKTATFLSVLKDNKCDSVIGGAMFSTDDRYLQFESAAKWQDTGFIFNRRNIDLRNIENVIKNEKKYDTNYNAWCYCCIPFNVVRDNNLPLPVFFHMDDVEYGLRNGLQVITLNGINVWHLYKKNLIVAKNDYYDTRNKLIMLSELNPNAAIKLAWDYFSSFTNEVLKYHYARAINTFDGILDFFKGIDWFKKTDTLSIHNKLYNNVSWSDANPELLEKATFSKQDVRTRSAKMAVLKSQLLPSFKTAVVYDNNSMSDTIGKRKIIVVNRKENKFIVYKKNLLLACRCFIKHNKIKRLLKTKLKSTIDAYNQRLSEVKSLAYWNQYLGLPNNATAKYKVLFVASDNDATSGAFRSMTVLCRQLKELYNVDAKVLLPRTGDGTKLLQENDIDYTIVSSEDWIVKLSDDASDIKQKQQRMSSVNQKALKAIEKYIKEECFDLVHINTTYHYVAAIAAEKLGVPVVWHLREFLEEDQQRKILDKDYGYKLINKSNKVVAISNSIFDKYKDIFDTDRLVRIYNGIDPEPFRCPQHTLFNDKKAHFLCAGAIAPYKGQAELVEACGKLKQRYNVDFELLLAGNNVGPYMQTINALICEYKLTENVKILGRRSDVNELMKCADITFVCSQAEAFGRVTVEAMMAGSLVIGANNAGTKELIEDGKDGLLYNVHDSDDLCEKIHVALLDKDKSKELAQAGTQKCLSTYTAQNNTKNIYDLHTSIIERKS